MEGMERYNRQIILPEFGIEGQKKLANSRVLVIGAGGLACPALQYLCSSGVGEITVLDADVVSISNLARQILFNTSDVGRLKVEVIKERLKALNPDVQIHVRAEMLSSDNVNEVLLDQDVVIDCTDNYQVRYLLGDACSKAQLPLVYAALHKYEGQLSVFSYKGSPSYREVFPNEELSKNVPTCVEVGVFSTLPAIMGIKQANECLKILLGMGNICSGKLLIYNAMTAETQIFKLEQKVISEQD